MDHITHPSIHIFLPKCQASSTSLSHPVSLQLRFLMSNVQRTSVDMEDPHEALYPPYYVQSPSTTTVSHANSAEILRNAAAVSSEFPLLSGHPNDNHRRCSQDEASLQASHYATLSRYSSSRGSNHSASFLHHDKSSAKVVAFDDLQSHDSATENGEKRLIIVDGRCVKEDDGEDVDDGTYYGQSSSRGGWWRFFSFSYSSSTAWVLLQVCWRLVVSLGLAMLVFYLVTKPPTPDISIKVLSLSLSVNYMETYPS